MTAMLHLNFSGKRLLLARFRRGLTQKAVADFVGISSEAISSFEKNEKRPSLSTLDSIAFCLDFPIDFFMGNDIDLCSIRSVTFRSRRATTAKLRSKTVATCHLAADLISPEFHRRFLLPGVDLPSFCGVDAEEAASGLRKYWSLGGISIPNLVHLLESKGVEVYWQSDGSNCVDAVSFWRGPSPFIILDTTKLSGERGRSDAAHELGHLILHKDEKVVNGKAIEDEANYFASAFLLPKEEFYAMCPKNWDIDSLLKLKKYWRVSIQMMVMRIKYLEIWPQWKVDNAFKFIGMQGWRKEEPGVLPRENSAIQKMVMKKLNEKGVSPKDFSDKINLNVRDFYEIVPESLKYCDVKTSDLEDRFLLTDQS